MDVENIITLMNAFSQSSLSEFKYEEGNTTIKFKHKEEDKQVQVEKVDSGISEASVTPSIESQTLKVEPVTPVVEADDQAVETKNLDLVSEETSDYSVKSPTVGTFYSSSSPDSDPFIQVGDLVQKGQVIGIVEAMKVMNEIESPVDGIVKEILVENEESVEFGQTIVVLG